MLHFTVIAGPNGAGKSTLSARISGPGALIFDPDLEKSRIERMYPDIADDAVESALNQKYLGFELKATVGRLHLTVETNLRNDYLAQRADIFKNNGYNTRMIFMMLPSLKSSMDRVNLRVKQKGHFVDAESIRYNFEKSRENFLLLAPKFDQLMLTCAPTSYGIRARPELLLSIQSGAIVQFNDFIPDWAIPTVEETIRRTVHGSPGHEHRPGR